MQVEIPDSKEKFTTMDEEKKKLAVQALNVQKPAIRKQARLQFNKSLRALIRNMRTVFPDDSGLLALERVTLSRLKDPRKNDIPLVTYAKAVMRRLDDGSDLSAQILRRDERIMTDPSLSAPLMQAIRISEKWPMLSPANQAIVWELLQVMTTAAIQYMVLELTSTEEMVAMTADFLEHKDTAPSARSIQERLETKDPSPSGDATKK